jgi:DNA polymerase-3 subunit delta'
VKRPAAAEEGAPESDLYPGAQPPRLAPAVIGHAEAQGELLSAYRSGRLAHAWLIAGPEGIGKATFAWAFARFVLSHPDPAAPEVAAARDLTTPEAHPAARNLAALAHPDFAVLRRAWNPKSKGFYGEIRVDDVREAQGVFRLAPAFGGWRILLVDAADDLNRAGANALLKTIEEPPDRSLALIVAHRPGRLPPTIRSRCRRLALEPLEASEIEAIVRAQGPPWSELPAAAVAGAAARAGGSAREALRRLDPEAAPLTALIDAVVTKLPGVDWAAALRLTDRFAGGAGAEAHERFVLAVYDWLAARARASGEPARLTTIAELWARLRGAAREAEALNLDRKIHALALLQEIAERAARL